MSNLQDRDQKVIWHPYTQSGLGKPPIGIVRGEGVYLVGEDGRKYIDAVSSWWVNIHGHSHPYIAEKVAEQLRQLEHTIFAGFTHEPAVLLAERLLKILPASQSRIFYSDNGSTAVEVAIKMALQFWANRDRPRLKIIAIEHAYLGDTFGAMSVSARGSFTDPFSPLLFDVIHIPFPGGISAVLSLEKLKEIIAREKDQVAAFIFEPLVLGAGGMLMYEPGTLETMIGICRENDILTIADEVMTGFGRTGKLFACDHINVAPDIICLSKGITGGTMPLGLTSCSSEIYNAFLSHDRSKTFFHGHSYTANPVACAAALASLDILLQDKCLENIVRISQNHQDFIQKSGRNPALRNLRSRGTILAMDFHNKNETSYFNPVRDRLYDHFIEKGVLLRPLGNVVYIMPPYCITDNELHTVYNAIESSVSVG
ncbi:MAG TPA: adenosylmethionine--8-amino-7-oxononanoate transaminase [Chitinophagaceae bacterium]|nr:adenosylmethionine--8-amino-7-oxononanoate transaminase [Chitinophagaceae bacterium]